MTSEDSRASSTGAATLKTLLLRQTAQDLGGISKRSYRLSKRNQIAPVGAMSFVDRSCHLRPGLKKCRFKRRNMRFERKHFLHTSEIQTFVGEFLNTTQVVDVGLAVAP